MDALLIRSTAQLEETRRTICPSNIIGYITSIIAYVTSIYVQKPQIFLSHSKQLDWSRV